MRTQAWLASLLICMASPLAAQQPEPVVPLQPSAVAAPPMTEGAFNPLENSGFAGGESQWNDSSRAAAPERTNLEDSGVDCVPLWTTTQGVNILNRSAARGLTLSTDISPTGRRGVLSGRDLGFGVAAGYDAVLERRLGRDSNNVDWYLQGGFWGLNDWVGTTNLTSAGRVTQDTAFGTITHGGLDSLLGGFFPGLDWADSQAARYNSRFYSGEINVVLRPRVGNDRVVLYPNGQWVRECQPGQYWSFLAGVRYFNDRELFELDSLGHFTGDVTGVAKGVLFTRASNNMVGLQFGTDVTFRQRSWDWGLLFKAAPLINTMSAWTSVDTENPILGAQSRLFDTHHKTGVSALLDVGVHGSYHITPTLALNAGYDVVWVTSVAQAPVQNPLANEINDHGLLFFQGLRGGLEWRF